MRDREYRKSWALVLSLGAFGCAGVCPADSAETKSNPTYVLEQATAGETVYTEYCAVCHGANLQGAEAPPLSGQNFEAKWAGKTVYEMFSRLKTTMPAPAPGSLSDEQYTNLLALIFQKAVVLAGSEALSSDPARMKMMTFPPSSVYAYARLEPGIALPPPPVETPNPLDRITPVTEAALNDPPDREWLRWRRTGTALGFSPLKQITRNNVNRLRVAWSWPLPSGANEATPLVHDGVLFVYGYGDVVQAIDAATGDLLWSYVRQLPKGIAPDFKRALALYGSDVFMPTSDGHVVALDMKTGEVVWDTPIAPEGTRMSGGPLVAKNKVIVGTNLKNFGDYRGGLIVALDTVTGKEVWRFATIPGPKDPGGNTWNDLPLDKRSGASVWLPGSFDPELNLVFFGAGQTYDTGPLLHRIPGSKSTNDGLYTDSTIALNPDTGKLVWFFQHMPNDQWDLDWAFERQIVTLSVNGKPRRVLVTAGKSGVHDVLDASTGKYLYSLDVGLQNFIAAIDPKTGAKTYDPEKIPGNGANPFVCPHSGGARSWIPSSFNPETKVLFIPLVEACMYMPPVPPGEGAMLTSGVRVTLSPREHSDGRYGRLQAVNLETGKTVWTDRQRAPRTSGALDTAGGIVFAGSLDRVFSAYDDATGKKLWDTRLSEVPNSAPISYAVNGKQYIAVVVGLGGPQSTVYMPLVPEIKNPAYRTSSIWVFELPDNP